MKSRKNAMSSNLFEPPIHSHGFLTVSDHQNDKLTIRVVEVPPSASAKLNGDKMPDGMMIDQNWIKHALIMTDADQHLTFWGVLP